MLLSSGQAKAAALITLAAKLIGGLLLFVTETCHEDQNLMNQKVRA